MSEHTILSLCARSHEHAVNKGFAIEGKPGPFLRDANLFQSETAEALEDYRNNRGLDEVWYTVKHDHGEVEVDAEIVKASPPELRTFYKPNGIPSELADVVIRICQRMGTEGHAALFSDFHHTQEQVNPEPPAEDFEEFLAWTNLNISLAFQADMDNLGDDVRLTALAQVVVDIFNFCDTNHIDLWAAIDEKEAYNKTRSFKHGGKKL